MFKISILNKKIVRNELKRIRNVKKDFAERNIEYDILVLKNAIKQIDKLLTKKEKKIIIYGDMWCECLDSLHLIIAHYGLKYVDSDREMYGNFKLTR